MGVETLILEDLKAAHTAVQISSLHFKIMHTNILPLVIQYNLSVVS